LGKKRAYFHVETPKLQAVFPSKLIQFSLRNGILDAPAYDTNGFLSRDTCVLSTQLNGPIWKKESISPL
jgi:hypothetical protein